MNTEIIKVARELGLYPRSTGSNPNCWLASCPGTNHSLCITAAEGEFGCGYCGHKGGIKELRALVNNRKKPKLKLATHMPAASTTNHPVTA